MIRVVVRHIAEAEGTLVGDFPPSEIPELILQFKEADTYLPFVSADVDVASYAGQQFAVSRERIVLEILVE